MTKFLMFIVTFLFAVGCARKKNEEIGNKTFLTVPENNLPPPPAEITQTKNNGASATVLPKSNIVRAELDDFGLAPELSNQIWLNTDQPLRLENLRGKVVLIDMWTFG